MANAETPLTLPKHANGSTGGSPFTSFIEKVWGDDQTEMVLDKARDARTSLTAAGKTAVAEVKARPALSILALIGAGAAIAAFANPTSRKAILETGAGLWKSLMTVRPAP
ncbi:MAG: hypothetical protein GC145_05015 [Caulobacter sp.]|nr:hypothetical protein [Caulobacter sp.]